MHYFYFYFVLEWELIKTTLCNGPAHSFVRYHGICCVVPSSHSLTINYYTVSHKAPRNFQATGHFAYFKSEFSICIRKCLYCSLPPPLLSFPLPLPASKAELTNVLSGKKKASTRNHNFTDVSVLSLHYLNNFILMYILIFLLHVIVCLSKWLMQV